MSGRVGSITTDIVSDGLVFNMDAANRASYPKSGTTVFNTANLLQSGSLEAGVGFSNEASGIWSFDGVDDYMTINNSTSIGFDRTTSFTMAGWFNLSANETNAPYWGKWGDNGASTGNYMFWAGNTTNAKVQFSVANGSSTAATTTAHTYTRDQWNYWVGVYTSNTKLDFYENGVLEGSANYTGAINNTSLPWTVNRATYLSGAQHFTGKANCLHIYNRALSSTEVLHNYNALKGRFE